jgi:recombination protein RecA
MAVELDVVDKRGSYYYYNDETLAQGRENAKQHLRDHPDLADQIENVVRDTMNQEENVKPVASSDDDAPGGGDYED